MSPALWIREAEVCETLDMTGAIAALREGLRLEASGQAHNMTKTHVRWGGGHTLHAIGATMPGAGLVGAKTWAHTAGGAAPLELVWDAESGELRAVIEAFALGQLRTGAITGIATDLLADRGARELAICGTGRQALAQVAAVASVRRLDRVRVFGRDPSRRRAFAESVGRELGLATEAFSDVGAAVHEAPILVLVTRATQPFLESAMVARGAHVNAIGAITPERAEFDADLLERCALIASDSPEQALRLSAELMHFLAREGRDPQAQGKVVALSNLLAAGAGRPPDADVTLFKAMGMGISDLALARSIYETVRERNLGQPLPPPRRCAPRLHPSHEVSSR
ncbi:MAG: ornithine cyclodeaminase family protein [Myxococcota bacterium]